MKTQVLDFGYIEFVEHWGSDERIIEAARMSTGKGFRSWQAYHECTEPGCEAWWFDGHDRPCGHVTENRFVIKGDRQLLSFLWKKKHTTPFEMGGAVIEVQAPIMVFREWHRHRTQSYNEMSARYTPLPDVNYIPSVERLLMNSKTNKQAGVVKGANELTEVVARQFQDKLKLEYLADEKTYQWALQAGVPKELARVHLPVGRYSRMRASANLLNWTKFLTLRMDPAAQWEIQRYANEAYNILGNIFPKTMMLFKGEEL